MFIESLSQIQTTPFYGSFICTFGDGIRVGLVASGLGLGWALLSQVSSWHALQPPPLPAQKTNSYTNICLGTKRIFENIFYNVFYNKNLFGK